MAAPGGVQQIALGQDRKKQLTEANRFTQQALELHRAGRDVEAALLAERALAIREKTLGAEHRGVANSLNLLAMIYKGEGDHGRAEQLYRRALAILEKDGADDTDVATVLNNLASLYLSQRDLGRAESLARRGLEIRESAMGSLSFAADGRLRRWRNARALPWAVRPLRLLQRFCVSPPAGDRRPGSASRPPRG